MLVRHATSADARKHTDTLEPPRHYLDLDDVLDAWPEPSSSAEPEGMGWQDYRTMVTSIDSTRIREGLGCCGILDVAESSWP